MKSPSACTAARIVIQGLRWAAVLALVYWASGNLPYSALGTLRQTAFVAAGALIAPRFRLTIAVVLAALQIAFSFWGHVLATGDPWSFGTIGYTHFSLETLGAVFAVVYVFSSEKAKRSVGSVQPTQLSSWAPPRGSAGIKAAVRAANTVVCWLRWVAVLAFVCSAVGGLVYSALHVRAPTPLAAIQRWLFMFVFHALRETALVVVGALLAPRFRLATAIVLSAVYVPLSFWNHVLSRVNIAELVLLQGAANYRDFALETLGAVLGVVYIYWSEKAHARCH